MSSPLLSTDAIRTRVRVNRALNLLSLRTPELETANASFESNALAVGQYVELGGSGKHAADFALD